jgi:hypothetical protein
LLWVNAFAFAQEQRRPLPVVQHAPGEPFPGLHNPLEEIHMNTIRTLAASAAIVAFSAAGAMAQDGMVTVDLSGVSADIATELSIDAAQVPATVMLPAGIAARACATSASDSMSTCTATVVSPSLVEFVRGRDTNGEGFVSVDITDVKSDLSTELSVSDIEDVPGMVMLPVGLAAQACGLNAAELTAQAGTGEASCKATSVAQGMKSFVRDAIGGDEG